MSYQIITLSSPTLHPAVTPAGSPLPTTLIPTTSETAEEGLNETGYKAMVTSAGFSNNPRDRLWVSVLHTGVHLHAPLRSARGGSPWNI